MTDTSNSISSSVEFEHKIQLQLSDSIGFPVPGTQFYITLKIVKDGSKVTIQFPTINFQTGPTSPIDPNPALFPGGYLYTSANFLPKDLRPNDLIYRSFLVPSNGGMSQPFSFTQDPSTLPTPPVGYILQVTNAGAIVVQCAGTFGNIIPQGPQILLPTDIEYIIKPKIKLGENFTLSTGFTDTTQFSNPGAANDGFRDTHPNDAFNNVVGWAWTDNSDQIDKTNNTMDAIVVIGKVKDGKFKYQKPFNLTNFGPNIQAWDTSVAINQTNSDNIVVSYGVIDRSHPVRTAIPYRAVSLNGGKTWPALLNGPLNVLPTGNPSQFGDNYGVQADKFGNIWYSYTNRFDSAGNFIATPTYLASSDNGISFVSVFTLPPPINPGEFYDIPSYCFGGDGQGNYGLWYFASYFTLDGDVIPSTGFIPILGLGQFGVGSFIMLNSLINTMGQTSIAAAMDGRVWFEGVTNITAFGTIGSMTYIQPAGVTFKSPGPLDQNYAGMWQMLIYNGLAEQYGISTQASQPIDGYFYTAGPRGIIYDEKRRALYGLLQAQFPDFSQNSRLYFMISRNNGQTWSNPIDISTTDFTNRGFQSMALDTATGNLIFGWYDGRNDKTFKSVEYFAAMITARELDELVGKISVSNPLYSLPSAAISLSRSLINIKMDDNRKITIQKYRTKKIGPHP